MHKVTTDVSVKFLREVVENSQDKEWLSVA